MKVTAVKVFTQNLADDLAPGAVLLLVALVVNSFELLVVILYKRIERSLSGIAWLINGGS
jgi:hypothetical protein